MNFYSKNMAARFLIGQTKSLIASNILLKRISFLSHRRCLHMGEYFTRGSLNEIELQTPVPLAGRKYLVSSNSPGFPKHLSGPREDFPVLVKARKGQDASMKLWSLRSRDIIDQAYHRYVRMIIDTLHLWVFLLLKLKGLFI